MRKAIPFLATVLSGSLLASGWRRRRSSAEDQPAATEQTYKWVDEKGVMHYGDQRPVRVFAARTARAEFPGPRGAEAPGGDVARTKPPTYAAKQKEESRRKQHDMFLISTYPSVKEIENVRDVRLDQINGQITAAEAYISSLTTRVDGLKQRALVFAPYNTKPGARRMPDDLAEEMVRAMSELRTQNSALTAKTHRASERRRRSSTPTSSGSRNCARRQPRASTRPTRRSSSCTRVSACRCGRSRRRRGTTPRNPRRLPAAPAPRAR